MKKQREDAAAEHTAFLGKYSGLDKLSPEQWGEATALLSAMARDPLAVVTQILDELGQNPATARQLQGWINQRFPTQQAAPPQQARPQPEDADPMPQPDADGGYTQAGLSKLLAWQSRRTMAELQKANAPLTDELTRLRDSRVRAEAEQSATAFASNLLTEVTALPGFKEHQGAIKAKFMAIQFPKQATNGDISAALYRCYLDVVMPTFRQSAKQDVLTSLDQKAKANTTSPTSRTTAAPQAKPLKLREALAAEFSAKD